MTKSMEKTENKKVDEILRSLAASASSLEQMVKTSGHRDECDESTPKNSRPK